jgi:tetratricopeptide (TPR) repeat protein
VVGAPFDPGETRAENDDLAHDLADDLRATMPEIDVAARVDLDAVRRRMFPDIAAPQRLDVGRFIVHRRLGSGAMGIVFEAWDPKLDRKIALKVLRGPQSDARAAERLLREARALAQLRHANVVAVHDVGVHAGQVFIAMDFVEGTTLTQWLQSPRRPTEILDLFVAAGRGLAAAHEAGLVHRDFKPDNVLVTADAEPLVVDFGVARTQRDDDDDDDATATEWEPSPGAATSMTAAGALVGTPAYMAPEQLRRQGADARSDQFAFGVALYEALLGQRPFAGATPEALLSSMREGAPPAAAGRSCPRGIRKIIDRALALGPDERYPSMLALVGEIQGTRRRHRRQGLALAGLAACGLGASAAALAMPSSTEAVIECAAVDPTMSSHWTDATKAKIEAAFAASGTPFAADAWDRVRTQLDDYAAQYGRMQVDACEATHVRGQQSTTTLELRLRCLDRRLAEVEGLLEVFMTADPNTVTLASDATDALTPVSVCANVEELQRVDRTSPLPEDPRARKKVEDLRRHLARLRSFHHAGRYQEGLAESQTRVDEAIALGHEPSIADAHYRVGAFLALRGDPQGAEIQLETAFVHALAGGDDVTGATIAGTAAHVVGIVLQRSDEGQRWARIAEALAQRVGDPPALVGRTSLQRGNAAVLRGEYEVGREALRRAASAFEEAGLEGELGETLTNAAVLERRAGDYPAATAAFAAAEPILLRVYGKHHPRISTFLNNRAALDIQLERWEAAEAGLQRAVAMMEETSGPNHASLAHPLNNLGEVYAARGEHERALVDFERALEIWRAALGSDHPLVAHTLTQRALSLHAVGRDADAVHDADAALQIRLRHGARDPDLAQTRYALALALPPEQRARAREEMKLALESLADGEEPALAARVNQWLEDAPLEATKKP